MYFWQVRDLEHQLAEERKTRLKQETRALTVASTQSKAMPSYRQPPLKSIAEKKPPLCPSKPRQPLRRITNFLPPPSPSYRTVSKGPILAVDKENIARAGAAANTKSLMKPRRISIATGRAPPSTGQVFQPRRRVSIATLRPESNLHMSTPLRADSLLQNASSVSRQSFVKDPRKARYSRLFSPMPALRGASETTPVAMKSSSKFMGSPPTQQLGSWKPKHPTVVALQRKSIVWSPLKWRGMKNMKRPSLLPSRPSSEVQWRNSCTLALNILKIVCVLLTSPLFLVQDRHLGRSIIHVHRQWHFEETWMVIGLDWRNLAAVDCNSPSCACWFHFVIARHNHLLFLLLFFLPLLLTLFQNTSKLQSSRSRFIRW